MGDALEGIEGKQDDQLRMDVVTCCWTRGKAVVTEKTEEIIINDQFT